MRLFKRNSSKHRTSGHDKLIVSPALPEDSCSDSRFAQGMDSGMFASMQETQARQDQSQRTQESGAQELELQEQERELRALAAAQFKHQAETERPFQYEQTSQFESNSQSDGSSQLEATDGYASKMGQNAGLNRFTRGNNLPFAQAANTPFTFISPEKPSAQSVDSPSNLSEQEAQSAQLFGSVAAEKDGQVSLDQMFCVNEQDEPEDTADFAARVGLGSACDDNFSFISTPSAESADAQGQANAQVQANKAHEVDASYESDGKALSDEQTDEQFLNDGMAQGNALSQDKSAELAESEIEYSAKPQETNVADEAAQLVANMMLGRNPLANITADTNTDLDQNANLDFTHLDADGNELQGKMSDSTPAMTLNLDEDGQTGAAQVGADLAAGESAEGADGASGANDAEGDGKSESAVADGSDGAEPAIEVAEEPEDDCLVNKRIKEPKHKIELVEEDEPPRATYLDPESEQQAVLAEQREDATVQAFVGNVEHTPQRPHFTLLRTQINFVDAPEKEIEHNLLSEEQEANGDKADINDFVTGNITTLRTGTDDVAVAASAGGAAAASSDAHNYDGDDSLEQPELTVEHVLEVGDIDLSEPKQYYTSTLPNLRGNTASPKLLPTIAQDMGRYFYVYVLAILLGVLCLIKVYQVQDTRNLTAQLNEVTINNEELEKEWLNLLATRQNLSEHAKVRSYATRQLEMVSPKTENEHVISLH